ncbi:class I adenylate-forming enzyme family protein [Rhodococcus sp. 114MFTsu3.1]|uniref:class I adenylate-forming enzyme family protein n=1 Tax=Rhodococcus sp. 114MFTsu3.1 TaxID=1172184 RepID=UPI000364ADF2|nr:class I adenylate-forming enzyme family protein [Rhodococcus sp. 114MFTsu3.1]
MYNQSVFSECLPLGDVLVRSGAMYPDHPALVLPDRTFSYADLTAGAVRVGRLLVALGVRPGDTVGVLAPNSNEFVEAMFGTALAGAVLVPLNPRLRSSELRYIITHAELKVLLTSDALAPRTDFRSELTAAFPELATADSKSLDLPEAPHLRRIVMLRGEGAPGIVAASDVEELAESVTSEQIALRRQRVRLRDDAMIIYTSGTTAAPKGCVLSHEAVTRGPVGRTAQAVPFPEPRENRVFWSPAPLFHIAAVQGLVACVAMGSTYLTDVYLDGDRALAMVRRWKPTSLWPMFQSAFDTLIDADGFREEDLAHATSLLTVGSAEEMRAVQRRFPKALLVNGSGMSEMAGHFSLSDPADDMETRATTSGVPVQGVEVRIIDPVTMEIAPVGELGELYVRGYAMMTRYFRDPEQTAASIDEEGWLRTGDLFRLLHRGYLRYEGRLKDMIKVGGENVPAIEVESYLCTHPDVVLAQVVAKRDRRLDEVPVAFVELRDGATAGADDIIAFCSGKIASFKVPRQVFFLTPDQWPRSATKMNKKALREVAAARS